MAVRVTGYRADILNRPDFVVDDHYRHHENILVQHILERSEFDAASSVHRYLLYGEAILTLKHTG